MHPYRTRKLRPLFLDDYVDYVRRRGAWIRLLRIGVVALGLAPLVIAWRVKTTGRAAPMQVEPPMSSASSTRDAPWGLFVSATSVHPWIGPLPEAAPRADQASGPLSADALQAEIATQAGPGIRQCYEIATAQNEDFPGTSGVLVASVLVRRDGTVDVGVGGDVRLIDAGVAACVDMALRGMRFGQPETDTEWFHYPIRFVAAPPAK